MERFVWLITEIVEQFRNIEAMLSGAMSYLPYIGEYASGHSNLIMLVIMAGITVAVLKPLVKWSIMILVSGVLLAAGISYFSGLSFWGVLPLTALGSGIVMFSNRFIMN